MTRLNGIVYCIHLVGVGHLKRMLMLCEGLLEFADITFVQGGTEVGMTLQHPGFTHIKLPIIKELVALQDGFDSESFAVIYKCMKVRKKILFNHINFQSRFDFLITEQIPFTKLLWLNEVISLIDTARIMNPKLLILCSHKGTTRKSNELFSQKEREELLIADERTFKILEKYYDLVMVHTDPRLINLKENYFFTDKISDKIVYTGFISKSAKKYPERSFKNKKILVTIGSGYKFHIFMKELLMAMYHLPEYDFTVIKGPMMLQSEIDLLNKTEKELSNLNVIDFVENLDEELLKHSLAIVMAGFTLINIYATDTPALVIPDEQEGSQMTVSSNFSKHRFIRTLSVSDITPERLRFFIEDTLNHTQKPKMDIDIHGVRNSVRLIQSMLKKKLLEH